jgi:hypothetical protein
VLLSLLFEEKLKLLNHRGVANFGYLDDLRCKVDSMDSNGYRALIALQIFALFDLIEYEGVQVPILEAVFLQGNHKSLRLRLLKHFHTRELILKMLGEGCHLVPVSMVQGEFQCSVLPYRVHNLIYANYHWVISLEPPKDDSFIRNCLLD